MIRIRRLEPEEVSNLERRMEQVVESLLHGLAPSHGLHGWLPRTDIRENASGTVLTIDLAGVRRDDIEILIEGPFLRVGGVRREPAEGECLRWHQMEIAYGPFERVFNLPADADVEGISAGYRDGFLEIAIPRRSLGSRQVPVDQT
jgi:HSP20 family protein